MLKRNPFYYDSKVEDFEDESALSISTVSRSSAALVFGYFDEDDRELAVTKTSTPVSC